MKETLSDKSMARLYWWLLGYCVENPETLTREEWGGVRMINKPQ
jgi:hypothetical protein